VRPFGGCVSPLAVEAKEEGWLAASHFLAGVSRRDAAPADGVHRDAAPANGGKHWDAVPALGGHLGWSAPIIGPVGQVVGAAAPFGGPCLAAGPPAVRVVVVRVILNEDFGLGVACIIDAMPPLAGGECLLPVEAVKGRILLVSRLLAGARGPACEHRLAHPTVELGGARGVLAPKAVRDFWGLEAAGGLSFLLFSSRRGPSHCACGATINRVHSKDLEQRVDLGGRVPPAAPPRGWVVPDGGFADASAAFPGVVWPTLRGLDVIDDIPSLEKLSSSSEGITSGPFASAAAFAVARRGGFV
jgi:hypothetical protein